MTYMKLLDYIPIWYLFCIIDAGWDLFVDAKGGFENIKVRTISM